MRRKKIIFGLFSVALIVVIVAGCNKTSNTQSKADSGGLVVKTTDIPETDFGECISLESIVIPEGITSIKAGTFSKCTSLKNIMLPSSVDYIDDYAFESCEQLTISCVKDSYAQKYAKEKGFKFKIN